MVESQKDRTLQGNKGTGKHHFPLPFPSRNFKGNQFPPPNLLVPCKGLPPSQCCGAPPIGDHLQQSKLSLPLPPLCTLRIHPANTPLARSHQSSTTRLEVCKQPR